MVQLDLAADHAGASIRLPAHDTGVAVVRQFVAGMAQVLHLDDHACEDLKLATTEACTNAVVHAYPNGSTGSMAVTLEPGEDDDLVVIVRDEGRGLPAEHAAGEGDGYGISLIQAVSHDLQLGAHNGGGLELRMRFRHARQTPDEPLDAVHSPVLRRVIALIAAHAGFSMDRLSDAVLVAETLAAHAPSHTAGAVVRVRVEDRDGHVILRVGPLGEGGAKGLLDASRLPAYGPLLEHLADAVECELGGDRDGEHLVVTLAPRG